MIVLTFKIRSREQAKNINLGKPFSIDIHFKITYINRVINSMKYYCLE